MYIIYLITVCIINESVWEFIESTELYVTCMLLIVNLMTWIMNELFGRDGYLPNEIPKKYLYIF